eukprot:g661.t1
MTGVDEGYWLLVHAVLRQSAEKFPQLHKLTAEGEAPDAHELWLELDVFSSAVAGKRLGDKAGELLQQAVQLLLPDQPVEMPQLRCMRWLEQVQEEEIAGDKMAAELQQVADSDDDAHQLFSLITNAQNMAHAPGQMTSRQRQLIDGVQQQLRALGRPPMPVRDRIMTTEFTRNYSMEIR